MVLICTALFYAQKYLYGNRSPFSACPGKGFLCLYKRKIIYFMTFECVNKKAGTNLAKSTADALRKNFGSVIKIYRFSIPTKPSARLARNASAVPVRKSKRISRAYIKILQRRRVAVKCASPSLFCRVVTKKPQKTNPSIYKPLRFCKKYAIIFSTAKIDCSCFLSKSCLNRG